MFNSNRRGFTLIELLIVVAIIGILAAIAVPNLLAALQRSKQKRTMSDMRNIANAWEARHIDENTYLPAGATATSVTFPSDVVLTWADMTAMLTPTFLRDVPEKDAWGHPLEYRGDTGNYFIRSPGKDGVYEGDTYTQFRTNYFDCDIVYSNGAFVVYPDGVQLPVK